MKTIIKNFLFKKRIKILKSKKGFSLMEVLIAVAIIGIISAIAVPQFTAQRNNAAKVASDTSAGNIAKAFKHCVALGSFNSCKTLGDIKVACPAGASCESGGDNNKFCAHIHKGRSGDDDFKVCVSVDNDDGTEIRSYGGALLQGAFSGTVCHTEKTASTDGNSCAATDATPAAGLVSCTTGTLVDDCGADTQPGATSCGLKKTCATPTTDGDCDKTTGLCS